MISKPPLVLGTAEFGRAYGAGVKEPPEESEIVKILNLAWKSGITTLDTADTYNCEALVDKYGFGFSQIKKTRDLKKVMEQGYTYHYQTYEPYIQVPKASVYTMHQIDQMLELLIVPISIKCTEFLGVKLPRNTYARSVFDRGYLLKDGYTIADCLNFVKRVKGLAGVIIGVNSVKELEVILKEW